MTVRLRVASYAVIVEDGRVLLPHWPDEVVGGWTLPGGGIEPGEDPADAAVREVLEETGYRVELDGLLGIDSVLVPAGELVDPSLGAFQWLRILYRAHVVGGELRDEADGSTDAVAWFDLAEVPSLRRVSLVDVGLRLAGESIDGTDDIVVDPPRAAVSAHPVDV